MLLKGKSQDHTSEIPGGAIFTWMNAAVIRIIGVMWWNHEFREILRTIKFPRFWICLKYDLCTCCYSVVKTLNCVYSFYKITEMVPICQGYPQRIECKDDFKYDDPKVNSSGSNKVLKAEIIWQRNTTQSYSSRESWMRKQTVQISNSRLILSVYEVDSAKLYIRMLIAPKHLIKLFKIIVKGLDQILITWLLTDDF